jgi:hypothetical protein
VDFEDESSGASPVLERNLRQLLDRRDVADIRDRSLVSEHQKYSRIKLFTIRSVDAANAIDAVVVAAGFVAGCGWPGSCQGILLVLLQCDVHAILDQE